MAPLYKPPHFMCPLKGYYDWTSVTAQPVYQLHIIGCGTSCLYVLQGVNMTGLEVAQRQQAEEV